MVNRLNLVRVTRKRLYSPPLEGYVMAEVQEANVVKLRELTPDEVPMPVVVRVVHFLVHLIVLAVWAVIGFVLWIPFLTRMILIFTGAVIVTIYKNSNPTRAQRALEAAIRFYIHGFEIISARCVGIWVAAMCSMR